VTCDRFWFSPDTPISSTNKTDCHDITEILLKVTLNTITCKSTYHTIRTMMALYRVRHSIFTLLLDVVDSSKEEFLKGSPEPNGSEVNPSPLNGSSEKDQ
jgi:hypothetical protein